MKDWMNVIKFVTATDLFTKMSKDAQLLYFHMVMNARGTGQVYNTRSIMKAIEVGRDALLELYTYNLIEGNECSIDISNFFNILAFTDDDGE